ncbi:MAG: hypothetical protein ACYCY6_01695 [Minisyncoccota bacterium]
MIQAELPRVTDEEAKQNLSDLINRSGDPFRVIQHLKDRVVTGGINGQLHSKCIIALLAECFGVSVSISSKRPQVSLRVFRKNFLRVEHADPHTLLPIEIYLLNVKPEDTSETSKELKVIAEYCDKAYEEFVYERNGMMVVS